LEENFGDFRRKKSKKWGIFEKIERKNERDWGDFWEFSRDFGGFSRDFWKIGREKMRKWRGKLVFYGRYFIFLRGKIGGDRIKRQKFYYYL
jgi:hypothetical protein